MRPFRFGLQLQADDPSEVAAEAAHAEMLGFDTVLVADHVGSDWSPTLSLAAAAAGTERIRLGTFVVNASLHNPLMLAREVATLDHLSGGRVELGLGAGHTPAEFDAAGVRLGATRRTQTPAGGVHRDRAGACSMARRSIGTTTSSPCAAHRSGRRCSRICHC